MQNPDLADSDAERESGQTGAIGAQLMLFAGKTLIVAVVFVVSILIVAVHIENKFNQFALQMQRSAQEIATELQGTTKIGGANFWKKMELEVDRAADSGQAITPERQEKILNDLRVITARWKPFLTDAYSIVAANPPQPADGAPTGK